MGTYREESEKAKAARREPAPDKMANVPSKSRKRRPVMRWGVFRRKSKDDPLSSALFNNKPWSKFETKDQAEEWIDKQLRGIYVPKDSTWSYQERMEKEKARWVIKELK